MVQRWFCFFDIVEIDNFFNNSLLRIQEKHHQRVILTCYINDRSGTGLD